MCEAYEFFHKRGAYIILHKRLEIKKNRNTKTDKKRYKKIIKTIPIEKNV